MQEVSIQPRSLFKHLVKIQPNTSKEIQYTFSTRKNNVRFGIYFQRSESLSRAQTQVPKYKVVDSGRSATSPSLSSNAKSFQELMEDADLVPVFPMAHYQSSKMTITGTFLAQEPGSYYLVFDNTFSVKTSKKLFFSVSCKEIQPLQSGVYKEIEGWTMKKGNLAMQGYQKRWAVIESNGVLTTCRGYASLKTAAVHVDHDRQLIDIDSGQDIFHFKITNRQEFQRWTAVIEKYADSKSGQELSQHFHPAKSIDTGLSIKPVVDMDLDMQEMKAYLSRALETLSTEMQKMKGLADTSKGRIDSKSSWKDFIHILGTLSSVADSVSEHVQRTQAYIQSYHANIVTYREQVNAALQAAETGFLACLADNNQIREKFGLDLTRSTDFIPAGFEHSELFPTHMNSHARARSYASTDEYYDAEPGREDEEDDDDSIYSGSDRSDDLTQNASSTARESLADQMGPEADDTPVSHVPPQKIQSLPSNQLDPASANSLNASFRSLSVTRRTRLPHPTISMENVSVMSILRNNVGKDLSKVAMPIALNEPLNLLQRLCEELEYAELLDKASKTMNPVERMVLMAGFVVSGYSSTIHRAGRKPFNPLLGETYECIRDDKGFRFVSEKVSHHPPIMACYAEGKEYIFYQDSLLKSKFWGKSMELVPQGTVSCAGRTLYMEKRYPFHASSSMSDHIYEKYLLECKSDLTGHTCELVFKESGYFTSSQNEIAGSILDPSGAKVLNISGRWDHSLSYFSDDSPDSLRVIWRAKAHPPHFRENYGFTQFAIELNELTDDIKSLLPSTDTRFRTDQRLYEEGKCEEADREKERLEQKQRDARKLLGSTPYTPKWFKQSPNGSSEAASWDYIPGGYFDKRGAFDKSVDLFGN